MNKTKTSFIKTDVKDNLQENINHTEVQLKEIRSLYISSYDLRVL